MLSLVCVASRVFASMVDRSAALPLAFAGGGAGLPCSRKPPQISIAKMSSTGEDLAFDPEAMNKRSQLSRSGDYSMQSFVGTAPISWTLARSRSEGMLRRKTVIDSPLKERTETGFDFLVEVLVQAMPKTRKEDPRSFSRPFVSGREHGIHDVPEDIRRKMVMRVMQEHPLADVYDLARCPPERWSLISRDLGGVAHAAAMAHALEYMKTQAPIKRASFWAAAGSQLRPADYRGACQFAGARKTS